MLSKLHQWHLVESFILIKWNVNQRNKIHQNELVVLYGGKYNTLFLNIINI